MTRGPGRAKPPFRIFLQSNPPPPRVLHGAEAKKKKKITNGDDDELLERALGLRNFGWSELHPGTWPATRTTTRSRGGQTTIPPPLLPPPPLLLPPRRRCFCHLVLVIYQRACHHQTIAAAAAVAYGRGAGDAGGGGGGHRRREGGRELQGGRAEAAVGREPVRRRLEAAASPGGVHGQGEGQEQAAAAGPRRRLQPRRKLRGRIRGRPCAIDEFLHLQSREDRAHPALRNEPTKLPMVLQLCCCKQAYRWETLPSCSGQGEAGACRASDDNQASPVQQMDQEM